MSSVNDIDAHTYQDNVLRIAEKIAELLKEVIKLKYRLFTEVELKAIEEKSVVLLEEYLKLCRISDIRTQTRSDESEIQEQVSNPDFLFHDLVQENRKLRQILKRQRVAEELQRLKQRFYAVTNTDTCMSYMKQMDLDAQGFLERLTADKAKTYCIDLIDELLDLIERITKYKSNTKKQIVIESITGVLTLGTASATGVVAAVGITGRTASAAASASAPAASRVASFSGSAAAPVVLDIASGTAAAANVANSVSKVAVISTTAARAGCTTVNVGKIVITAGSAITEAINIGTAVTNAKPQTTYRNRVRHDLLNTLQETHSNVSSTTQSHTDTDTQTYTRTMALIVYEKLINDEDTYLMP